MIKLTWKSGSFLIVAASLFAQEREVTVALPGGATMEMVWIEPGKFMMGWSQQVTTRWQRFLVGIAPWATMMDASSATYHSSVSGIYEGPQHQVTISQGFYLARYELTQGQWEAVMATAPWVGKEDVVANPQHPAVYISWDDAQEFIRRVNESEGSAVFRMPTEAEWEYACRAGTTTKWSFGDDKRMRKLHGWYDDNVKKERYAHAIGGKLPNPWGLYDMHGNVSEWVQDWIHEKYSHASQVDPVGPEWGNYRGRRGGSFNFSSWGTRSTARGIGRPEWRGSYMGIRLLRKKE